MASRGNEAKTDQPTEEAGKIQAITDKQDEEKTNKRKKRTRESSSSSISSSSSSSSESSSSSSEEERKRKKKKKHKKRKRKSKDKGPKQGHTKKPRLDLYCIEDKNVWSLDEELAKYIEQNIVEYIPDKDIKKDVLGRFPIPSNTPDTLKMDLLMETFLKGKNTPGRFALARDKSLVRISNKIRDIYGPISSMWQQMETFRQDKENGNGPNVLNTEELCLQFQNSIMLIRAGNKRYEFLQKEICSIDSWQQRD